MLFKEKIPGLILCFIIAIPSWLLGLYLPLIGAPVFAILIGIIVGSFYQNRQLFNKGIAFTSKYIL
ncbi:TPA: putative sulfate exporter family transporter, partial [Streptococcus agalactiae]